MWCVFPAPGADTLGYVEQISSKIPVGICLRVLFSESFCISQPFIHGLGFRTCVTNFPRRGEVTITRNDPKTPSNSTRATANRTTQGNWPKSNSCMATREALHGFAINGFEIESTSFLWHDTWNRSQSNSTGNMQDLTSSEVWRMATYGTHTGPILQLTAEVWWVGRRRGPWSQWRSKEQRNVLIRHYLITI